MADSNFGLSFSPLAPDGAKPRPDQYGGGDQAGGTSPIQQAIQILSIRRPHFFGAQSIAPNALLGGQGGLQGQPDFSALMQTLQRQFGFRNPGFGVPTDQRSGNVYQPPVMPGGGSAPMPNIGFGDATNPNPAGDVGGGALPPMPQNPGPMPMDLSDRKRV